MRGGGSPKLLQKIVIILPAGAPKLFDLARPLFPRSGECFDVEISRNPLMYRSHILHVHFITVEVGVVRRGAGRC